MNRHRRSALLAAPLLASSVAFALAPAHAAPGRTSATGAARPVPACALIPHTTGGAGGNKGYDLHLSGFSPQQSVRIEGPKTSFKTTVDAQGKLDRQGVRYGTYQVSYKPEGADHSESVHCQTPPRNEPDGGRHDGGKQDVKVTRIGIKTLTKDQTVDCSTPQKAEFDGLIEVTGTGKVSWYWTLLSSADPIQKRSHTFEPGNTGHSDLLVVPAGTPTTSSKAEVRVTLHVPEFNLVKESDLVTFTCKQP
ncbi:hypothetical protein AB0953_22225 [Streptomyces sp. NPDC046866]|uniref:hypothetical protein n=1 Tax=Streptomyces sp. NPDC046866 TaxID=3154921 RepID=UPI003453DD98